MADLEYLCIGHVTRDLAPTGASVGGTVTFSSRTARALGWNAAALTSAEADYDLDTALAGIRVQRVPAAATTTFENLYTDRGRQQVIHQVAAPLGPADVPAGWHTTRVLHLGPVAAEVDPAVIHAVQADVIGLTPQGWHRRWDGDGAVGYADWLAAAEILPLAMAVIVSVEDIRDEATWRTYRQHCRLLVVTHGAAGCEVEYGGQSRRISAPAVQEADPTGVGDIFAAAFFIRLHESGGDPWEAARFATRIAAPTVARRGLDGLPRPEEVAAARQFVDQAVAIDGQGRA